MAVGGLLAAGGAARGAEEGESRPLVLALVVDRAGRMGQSGPLEQVRQVARSVLRTLGQDDLLVIAACDRQGGLLCPAGGASSAEVVAAVEGLQAGGETDLAGGLRRALTELLKHPEYDRAALLMSDGLDDNHAQIMMAAQEFLRKRIPIHVMAFGQEAETGLLEAVAKITGGRFITVGTDFDAARFSVARELGRELKPPHRPPAASVSDTTPLRAPERRPEPNSTLKRGVAGDSTWVPWLVTVLKLLFPGPY